MKFLDSAKITVIAGTGGHGCISFQKMRKKKSCSKKPDGSNGGDGGSVWLFMDHNVSTLSYFRFNHIFKAQHGFNGGSRNRTGKKGKDLIIKVPPGTRVRCQQTNEVLIDMVNNSSKRFIVARGGRHGLGNSHFLYSSKYCRKKKYVLKKSSLLGTAGELRHLILELILIADVGVFGLPNSGKSSFLRLVSQAKPKVSDYPFTTLIPNLGVVQLDNFYFYKDNKFIVADIPGIVRGASKGFGLGAQFLKHLERCSMLLHFVDINPIDKSDPIQNILSVEKELLNYNVDLIHKPRWLVFNKIDLLNFCTLKNIVNCIIKSISWKDRYYTISVVENINIQTLCYDIIKFINQNKLCHRDKIYKNLSV